MTRASFVEFATAEEAQDFLKAAPSTTSFKNPNDLKIKPALTKINSRKNWALRRAEELIKQSPAAQEQSVRIDWKSRSVTVNNTPAFVQMKDDLIGSFYAPFSALTIP